MTEFSLQYPFPFVKLGAVRAFAHWCRRLGVRRLWLGESQALDTTSVIAWLSHECPDLSFGTAVVLTPWRHPRQLAHAALTVSEASGSDFFLGIGVSEAQTTAALTGASYTRPLDAARDYVRLVRAELDDPVLHPRVSDATIGRVHVGLGVLRPGMARAASEQADFAVTWLTPPDYLRRHLSPALAREDSQDGDPVRVVAMTPVGPAADGCEGDRLAAAATQFHRARPHYAKALRSAGVECPPHDPAREPDAEVGRRLQAAGVSCPSWSRCSRTRATARRPMLCAPASAPPAADAWPPASRPRATAGAASSRWATSPWAARG